MKFKKQSYKIIVGENGIPLPDLEIVDGLTVFNFGYHKDKNTYEYHATHLPTGYCIGRFKLQREVKNFIDRILCYNSWPVDWSTSNINKLAENATKIYEIRNLAVLGDNAHLSLAIKNKV